MKMRLHPSSNANFHGLPCSGSQPTLCAPPGRPFGRSAFTLVELLVVIAIIALIAAILFPAFNRARENARRSSCQSNLKQIGLGMLQYMQDYDETFSPSWSFNDCEGTPAYNNSRKWMDLAYPYIKNDQVFNCPSQSKPPSPVGGETKGPYTYSTATDGNSSSLGGCKSLNSGYYGLNVNYSGGRNFTNPPTTVVQSDLTVNKVVMSQVQAAATTIWITDSMGYDINWGGTTPTAVDTSKKPEQVNRIPARHLEMFNALYVDAHVKATRLDSLFPAITVTKGALSEVVLPAFTIEED